MFHATLSKSISPKDCRERERESLPAGTSSQYCITIPAHLHPVPFLPAVSPATPLPRGIAVEGTRGLDARRRTILENEIESKAPSATPKRQKGKRNEIRAYLFPFFLPSFLSFFFFSFFISSGTKGWGKNGRAKSRLLFSSRNAVRAEGFEFRSRDSFLTLLFFFFFF